MDGDGVGNTCDNCVAQSNLNQLDADADGQGDVCDSDLDGDTVPNGTDSCSTIPNGTQTNLDADVLGDACDDDVDGDGFANTADLCPWVSTSGNTVSTNPACRRDGDLDAVDDAVDNCLGLANGPQSDLDADGRGDACDVDDDNDGIPDLSDNCAAVANRGQLDGDDDNVGDVCDARFCLVIDPTNAANCLDPAAPFRVSAGGSSVIPTGLVFRLPLYANRDQQAIRYQWTVLQRPVGSTITLYAPSGTTSRSRAYEYVYSPANAPATTAFDLPGQYRLQVLAELVSTGAMSTAALDLTVTGTPVGPTCFRP